MNREAKGLGPVSDQRKGRVVLWAGLALVALALAGTGLWQLLSQKPTTVVGPDINTGVEGWVLVATPQATAAVVAQGNTPTANTPPQTPAPSATVDQANLPPENTPTLIPGGATFTPAPDTFPNAAGKPRVLGITAGVGMRAGYVAGTAPLAVTFSDAMDQASAQAAFGLNPAATGNFAWKANTLLFTPDRPLSPSTSYTVTLAGQARSQAGETVASPLSASFKTAPPPSILRTLPSQGASDVPTDTIVTLTFNRPMIPLTALDSQPDPGQWASISPAVKGRWVWLGTSAVGFRADEGFLPATGYTVAAKAGWPDADGVTMPQGASVNFTTVRPAILSVSPSNHANGVDLDAPTVVEFNMPMDHASVQSALNLPVAATPAWSSDSTVVTFTLNSLLSFSKTYSMQASGKVRPINGVASDLAGDAAANTWSFTTTSSTEVSSYYPNNDNGPAQPADSFSFSFNNPLAPNQDVARLLTVDPLPGGYNNKLEVDESNVYTGSIKLLPDTTYKFELKAGLKDKWGFPVAPARWEVRVGPLPPSVQFPGGGFQPVYVDGPSHVRLDATNVATVTLRLYSLTDKDMSDMLAGVPRTLPGNSQTNVPYGTLKREWTIQVPKSGDGKASVLYPAIDLDGKSGRLPGGYYGLVASIDNPYNSNGPTEARTVLIVGHTGVVVKTEGRNLFVWAADLGSVKPVAGYKLRVEQIRQGSQSAATVQRGVTGKDGVLRLALDPVDGYASTVVWSDQPDDAMVAATGWSRNLYFGYSGGEGRTGERASVYTARPIYRPAQVVYFRGAYRMDDDARYSLAPAGQRVAVRAFTYGRQGQTAVYTGTATLSPLGTISGQFTLPADAPTGDYTLSMDGPGQKDPQNYGSLATVGFRVEEYRKPDFQVGVTARDSVVHGDPVTATIASSYYFGGPLSNVTATVNLRSDPYYFGWSDPVTGESYSFGLYTPPIYEFYRPGPPQGEQGAVQSLQVRTGADGIANVDVRRFVTTTEGSRTLLVEGQVQDLSNQAVANSTSVVVHQGSFYVGLRTSDYLAEAKQPITVTVRTVDSSGKRLQPNAAVTLHFVRHEWHAPAPGSQDAWQVTDVPAGDATVRTDADGRAIYRFTPQEAGSYGVLAESRDSRGNAIKSSYDFYVYGQDPGFVPWRFSNEQQVQLVADKKEYKAGDVARILVTSPFTQATALLTVERGHVRRYRIVTLTGSAPTLEVPLEDGDLPNVFVGLTLLGKGQPPVGAPADWANKVSLRQGYVPLSLDTSSKKLNVSIEPQGKGPFEPGTTASVRVTTHDAGGKPASGELSLAVVDEAIYALTADNATPLFDAFWGERGLGVNTSSSFTSNEGDLALSAASEAMPAMGAGAAPGAGGNRSMPDAPAELPQIGGGEPTTPKKVRADFRDTAFWQATVTTGADGIATVAVPLPDNLTTWRLTAHGINGGTQAGEATTPMTVTQPLLLRPVQPRFFTVGDNPHPQAIIHNNTDETLTVEANLEISGSLSFPPASVNGLGNIVHLTIQPGTQAVATWMVSVGKGDVANLRYWVHTVGNAGQPGYREDAVSAHIPVKAFAAPEAVATSGEVSGTRADESIFLPYSVNPLLGEMVVQVSPSLAAAATNSIHFLEDYPYDSTDMAVSRFLPLVTLEKVYNEQGLKTPYAAQIPAILGRSLKRLEELQQPDGGWAWWERGPSDWWETGYAVQGLAAARDAGYTVPAGMLQRGVERLRNFQADNGTPGIDETYHLNMRAYSLYVLAYATGSDAEMKQEGQDLAAQASRISNHARAWLAMALGKMGMSGEAKATLDSLAAAARQSSTTAHWEEDSPDYWSMGTDNRATALAIDALVTLSPNDPLTPKAVRWLMTAEKEGHWLSTQETSISLVSLAHYIRATKELSADYSWQVTAFDKLLGSSVANSANITQTATLRMPISGMPQNTLGTLGLARSNDKGKMYYQVSLRYYVPGEGIKSRSEGLSITRSYYKKAAGGDPVKEANAGDLLRVRLSIVVPETSYYVMVTDPLPAGLEGVNGSLNTTSFTERPPNPTGIDAAAEASEQGDAVGGRMAGGFEGGYYPWRQWGPFSNVEMRDDRTVLFANYMAPGTYVYEYYARATTPGTYMSLPAHAELLYYPDVFGHSDGGQFTVK